MHTIKMITDLIEGVDSSDQETIKHSIVNFISVIVKLKERGMDPASVILVWELNPSEY